MHPMMTPRQTTTAPRFGWNFYVQLPQLQAKNGFKSNFDIFSDTLGESLLKIETNDEPIAMGRCRNTENKGVGVMISTLGKNTDELKAKIFTAIGQQLQALGLSPDLQSHYVLVEPSVLQTIKSEEEEEEEINPNANVILREGYPKTLEFIPTSQLTNPSQIGKENNQVTFHQDYQKTSNKNLFKFAHSESLKAAES